MTSIEWNQARMKEFHIQKHMIIEIEEDVLQAMAYTDYLAGSLGFLPNDQLLLRLVTEEAVVNALEYSVRDGQDVVEVFWNISNEEFVISVKQPGPSFKIIKEEQMNDGPRGRGLQLILHIMDEVWLEQEEVDRVTLYMKKFVK